MTSGDGSGVRWAPHLTVRSVPGEAVYLLSESGTVVLENPLLAVLAPLVDGTRSTDDLAESLDDHTDLASAYFLLDELMAKGYLAKGTVASPDLWALAAEWGTALPAALPAVAVGAVSVDSRDADAVAAALAESGLDVQRPDTDESLIALASDPAIGLVVAVCEDYLHPLLPAVDKARRTCGMPWLLVRNSRAYAWIGPLLTPGDGPCWHCLAHRVRGNREVEEYLRHRAGVGDDPVRPQTCGPAVTRALTAGLAGAAALRALLRPPATAAVAAKGKHSITTLELASGIFEDHIVHRRPQCAACGEPTAIASEHPPVVLAPAPHEAANDSGYRSVPPSVTLARFAPHISSLTGAVTGVTRLELPTDEQLYVFAAGHNFAMRGADLRYLRAGLRTKSSGKGLTEDQARVSAVAEAIERYQGLYTGEEPRRRTSMRELGTAGLHPNSVMLWSEQQFLMRDQWNALDRKFAFVPEPFDEDVTCDFSPLWSLTERRTKWLPTGQLYYAAPRPDSHTYFIACSNGTAAGNTIEEAVLQGILELVERDAVAIWWYNRLSRPEIDPYAFGDPEAERIAAAFERFGRPIRLLDLTNDLGIPVVAAVSARDDAVSEDILLGFGAHLDPRIAAIRAMAEVVQFYPAVAPHAADGSGRYDYDDDESQQWWLTATRSTEPYLVPNPVAPRAPHAPGVGPILDMAEAVGVVRQQIERAGHEVLILDQTRPDIGFPTVKVVAPGLRHFWARYAPGRLYQVPVDLGWLPAPTPEDQLNPRVMFL